MVHILKQQFDKDVDHHCEPFGSCGASGAPFKLRCIYYGYTFVGKGTTSRLWSTVSSEAQFYQILRSAQGSAVTVFLGLSTWRKVTSYTGPAKYNTCC